MRYSRLRPPDMAELPLRLRFRHIHTTHNLQFTMHRAERPLPHTAARARAKIVKSQEAKLQHTKKRTRRGKAGRPRRTAARPVDCAAGWQVIYKYG